MSNSQSSSNHIKITIYSTIISLISILILGTIFSCSIYKNLSTSPYEKIRRLGQSLKHLLNNSGYCYPVVDEDSSPSVTTQPNPPLLISSQPTIDEINIAIAKLNQMNSNQILEFPVEEDQNYRIIGYMKDKTATGWNVITVKKFLQDSLNYQGKFPENNQISLIVRNQSTNKRLVLKPINKNETLTSFVRSLNAI